MAFLNGQLDLQIYTDAAQTEFPQISIPEISMPWTNSSVTGIQPLYFNLAASGTQAVTFNGLTGVTQFYLYSDAANLTLTINGTAGFTYTYGLPGFIPVTLTSLSITNASSTVATNVTLILIKG